MFLGETQIRLRGRNPWVKVQNTYPTGDPKQSTVRSVIASLFKPWDRPNGKQ